MEKAILMVPPLLVAVILHEIAHAWVALKLGDPTAKNLGRITLNPIKHIDPVMTILLPAILIFSGSPFIFGGAKPVPVNPFRFKNPRRGMAYVAVAGPISNFIIAGICILLLLVLTRSIESTSYLYNLMVSWLAFGFLINIILALFNLLPIPPLDGGRIAVGFLPKQLASMWAKLEPFGLIIIIALLAGGTLNKVLEPVLKFSMQFLGKI